MDFVAKTLIQVIRIAIIGQALEIVPITMLDGWILIAKALVEDVAKILMAMITLSKVHCVSFIAPHYALQSLITYSHILLNTYMIIIIL